MTNQPLTAFADTEGVVWRLRLSIGTIKKVLKDTGINLGGFDERNVSYAHIVKGDVLQLVSVLYSMLEKDIVAAKLTEEEFAERLYGDVIGAAREAFWESYLDFCPSQQRNELQELETKTKDLQEAILSRAKEMKLEDLIALGTPTKQPDSAESIRTHLHNGS